MIKTAVIMAGGSGERFWPLSKKTKPKQLLKLINENKTMLEDSIERVLGIIPAENIFIITSKLIVENIKSEIKLIPSENIIAEPYKRNTAPCLALASAIIKSKFRNEIKNNEQVVTAVLTADHVMTPIEKFQQDVISALDFAANHDSIVTIGIVPTKADTGFGYIELGDNLVNNEITNISTVNSFKEKPNLETAKVYFESKNYYWNSGMFFYDLNYFNTELCKNLTDVGSKIVEMEKIITNSQSIAIGVENTNSIFKDMPDISIDYGLMEKTPKVAVVKSNFNWDDLGSWDSIEKYLEVNNENYTKGNTETIDSKGNIIYNYSNDKLISLVGVEDLIVVNSDDVILILPKDKAQDVKKIVNKLKEQNRADLL